MELLQAAPAATTANKSVPNPPRVPVLGLPQDWLYRGSNGDRALTIPFYNRIWTKIQRVANYPEILKSLQPVLDKLYPVDSPVLWYEEDGLVHGGTITKGPYAYANTPVNRNAKRYMRLEVKIYGTLKVKVLNITTNKPTRKDYRDVINLVRLQNGVNIPAKTVVEAIASAPKVVVATNTPPITKGHSPIIVDGKPMRVANGEIVVREYPLQEYFTGEHLPEVSVTQLSPRHKAGIFERKGIECAECGEIANRYLVTQNPSTQKGYVATHGIYTQGLVRMTLDHIIPRVLGGPNAQNNLQPMCQDCNKGKGHTLPSIEKVPTELHTLYKEAVIRATRIEAEKLGPGGIPKGIAATTVIVPSFIADEYKLPEKVKLAYDMFVMAKKMVFQEMTENFPLNSYVSWLTKGGTHTVKRIGILRGYGETGSLRITEMPLMKETHITLYMNPRLEPLGPELPKDFPG